jgi:hypothetical protein
MSGLSATAADIEDIEAGSAQHRHILAQFFLDSYVEYDPEQMQWPSLPDSARHKLTSLPSLRLWPARPRAAIRVLRHPTGRYLRTGDSGRSPPHTVLRQLGQVSAQSAQLAAQSVISPALWPDHSAAGR